MIFIKKTLFKIGFWLPILLFLTIIQSDFLIIYGCVIFALIIILVSNLTTNNRLNVFLELFGTLIFNAILFIQIVHSYLFSDHIHSSTFFIIFDSNTNETAEFLAMYLDFNIGVIFLLQVLGLLVALYLRLKNKDYTLNLKVKIIYVFIIFLSLSFYPIRSQTFPHILYRAITDYKKEKKILKEVTLDPKGGVFSKVKHTSSIDKEVYVLIIGESTTRTHMQLYNYYRDTNPYLTKIKNDLIIFDNVISPHTHTIPALEKVLTMATHDSPNRKFDGTLIQLFNKAGFKTYWLSNQKPMGIHETATTIISNNCEEQIFVNTTHKSSDINLLKPFQRVLNKPFDKKFIVIHLMGTHGLYFERYPDSFDIFKDKPKTKFNHDEAYTTINEYDNANIYNDFIVYSLFELLKGTNSKSYALYFSDHGEDVFETMNIALHKETNGSKPMYDIPFILWQSNKFKSNDFVFDTSRKYSTENLIHTLADLSNLSFAEFDSTQSIVNKNFIPRERPILNNIDYDIYFKEK